MTDTPYGKVRIIAAVVDKQQLKLYKPDGSTIEIPQGDSRVRKILDEATPQLLSQKYADVYIEVPPENSYAHFEEKSSGLMKFFKVAKDKLKQLFGKSEPVEEQTIGILPGPVTQHIQNAGIYEVSELDEAEAAMEQAEANGKLVQTKTAIDEILQHAVPVRSAEFHEKGVGKQGAIEECGSTNNYVHEPDKPDTIIAVVDGKVIAGMERIKSQFSRAAKHGSTVGVENFLKRLAAVIDQRQHSIDELLNFLERADLPIAEDGSILIYKVLQTRVKKDGTKLYVDCRSKKVEQWVGAYVCMDPKLVDMNRRQECSVGLHVARRGYVRGFTGNACVLGKLAPEDVIAVPHGEANKLRACGYHIIKELSDKQYQLLKQNRPITDDPEGKIILADAIAGRHIGMTHRVEIRGALGANVVTTNLENSSKLLEVPEPEPVKVVEEAEALPNDAEMAAKDTLVDPVAVAKVVTQTLNRKEQAMALYKLWAAARGTDGAPVALDNLMAFKKAAKKGWDALGIPDPALDGQGLPPVYQNNGGYMPKVVPSPTPAKKKTKATKPVKEKKMVDFTRPEASAKTKKLAAELLSEAVKPAEADPFPNNLPPAGPSDAWPFPPAPVPAEPVQEATGEDKGFMTVKDILDKKWGAPAKVRQLLVNFRDHLGDIEVAQAILDLKKASKKSWEYLGLSEAQVCLVLTTTKTKKG